MKIITIPNLYKYQHYSDRHILWVKLYIDILQDYKFCQLTNDERWIFIGLILLAVKNDNETPLDLDFIAKNICFFDVFKQNKSTGLSRIVLKLNDLKLISIKVKSKCYQGAILDKKREEEIREEKKASSFKKRPFYKHTGEEMRWKNGKWWVVPSGGGSWLEFAGAEKDIEYK